MNGWIPRTLLMFAAGFGVGLTGCGGSSSPPASIASPGSSGQAAPIQEWIVGTWNGVVQLDREAAAQLPEMTPEAISVIESMKMQVVFDAQGEMKMSATMQMPSGERQSSSVASWEVVEATDHQLKIKSQEEGHDPEEVEIKRLDGQRFSMPAPQNVGSMVFTRVKQ